MHCLENTLCYLFRCNCISSTNKSLSCPPFLDAIALQAYYQSYISFHIHRGTGAVEEGSKATGKIMDNPKKKPKLTDLQLKDVRIEQLESEIQRKREG